MTTYLVNIKVVNDGIKASVEIVKKGHNLSDKQRK